MQQKQVKENDHDTTRHNSTRHDTRRHTHTRPEGTHTHNKKNANEQTETTKGTSRSFFKIREKTTPKNINKPPKIDQKSIKNESWSSPGDPSGQRPVFETFFDVFWTKIVSKMEPETIQQICFFCLFFRCRFTSIFKRKVITFGVHLRLILRIFATLGNHQNDAAVQARASI